MERKRARSDDSTNHLFVRVAPTPACQPACRPTPCTSSAATTRRRRRRAPHGPVGRTRTRPTPPRGARSTRAAGAAAPGRVITIPRANSRRSQQHTPIPSPRQCVPRLACPATPVAPRRLSCVLGCLLCGGLNLCGAAPVPTDPSPSRLPPRGRRVLKPASDANPRHYKHKLSSRRPALGSCSELQEATPAAAPAPYHGASMRSSRPSVFP